MGNRGKHLKRAEWLLAQLVFALEVEADIESLAKNKVLGACLESAQDYLAEKNLKRYAAHANPLKNNCSDLE